MSLLPNQNGKELLATNSGAQEAQSMERNGSYCLSRLSLETVCRLVKTSELEVRMGPYHLYVLPICGVNTRVVLESVLK